MRENEQLYSISQHQKLSKSKKTVSLMYICCIWGLYLNKRRKTHFPLVTFTLDTGCMYNSMASIMWSYQPFLPLAQHHKCFFSPSFERLVWDLNHSFYLKSLCSLHRWYSLTLPDPRFLYLPYRYHISTIKKEAVIMKHTTMKMRGKMLTQW